MSSIKKVWSAYKVNPASEALYTDDVFVVYLPTSAGGRGLGDVVRFYSQQDFVPSVNVVKETVHKMILTEDAVVEEVEWSVTFTSGECSWLLPNLDKSHLVDATVIFPAVISANFSAGKISSLRVYWDQASLLKQIKVIGERQRWPIRGIEQIDALRKPHMLQLNPFGRGSEAVGGRLAPSSSLGSNNGEPPKKHPMTSNIFDAEPEAQRLSSRVNQPGGTGGRSTVFGEDAPPSDQRLSSRVNRPGGTGGRSAIFEDAPPSDQRLSSRVNQPGGTGGRSTVFGEDTPPSDQRLSSRVNRPGGTGGRSAIFEDAPPSDQRLSSRVNQPGGTGGRSTIFGEDASPSDQRLSSRVNQPGGTGGKSTIFDEDAPLPGQRRTTGKGILPGFDPDEPDPALVRSPPRRTTGKSILPGFDDEEPAPQRLSSRVNQPGGTGGKSRIFDSEEFTPSSPPSRPFAGKSNQSTVFDEQPVGMSSSISGNTRRANTADNQSHLTFAEIDDHQQREAQQRREERAAAAAAAGTNANDTLSPSISSTTTASDSSSRASRRQNAAKNDAHFSFSDEETGPTESLSASGRNYSSRANNSSISFAAADVATTSLSGSTKGRSKAVFNESQLDKDTSNDGDYRKYITPSSRVLKAPGGGSSITFG